MNIRALALGASLSLAGLGLTITPAQAHDDRSALRISVHAGGHQNTSHRDSGYRSSYRDYGYSKRKHLSRHASKYDQRYDRRYKRAERYAHGHRKHRHTSYCPEYAYRDQHHRKARYAYQALRHLDYYAHRNHY